MHNDEARISYTGGPKYTRSNNQYNIIVIKYSSHLFPMHNLVKVTNKSPIRLSQNKFGLPKKYSSSATNAYSLYIKHCI